MDFWSFRSECEAFARARDRGGALEMRTVAGNLARLASGTAASAFAASCRLDANARLGRIDDIDERAVRANPYVGAELALLAGDAEAAERLALGALLTARDGERYRCVSLISRARFARGAEWRAPNSATSLPPNSWDRIAVDLEIARHFLRSESAGAAEQLVRSVARRADAREFKGLAAGAAGLLHACALHRGAAQDSLFWRARAIAHLLPAQDRLLAAGLFPNPCEEPLAEPQLLDVLYERLCAIVPQMYGEAAEKCGAVRGLIAALCGSGDAASCAQSVERNDCALAHYFANAAGDIAEMLGLAIAALTQRDWIDCVAEVWNRLDAIAGSLRPAVRRTIAVAVPEVRTSQTWGGVHFNDNGRSHLRLRLLSIRSGTRAALARCHRGSIARSALEVVGFADSRQRQRHR